MKKYDGYDQDASEAEKPRMLGRVVKLVAIMLILAFGISAFFSNQVVYVTRITPLTPSDEMPTFEELGRELNLRPPSAEMPTFEQMGRELDLN